ncbi:helix-turn-helix domain-containing protein [Gemmiger formicilis]|uniref:helix-turn-helix domain-containing protein n=1 Tax=Gemmiger formicilis TaxID=745368 RepID=UPI003CCAE6EC
MYLGSRLKELRQKANITQKELSEKTNISLRSIINYENNLREPNSRAMAALERYFGVTGDYLRGGVDRSALIVRDGQVLNGLDELDNQMYRFKDAYRATKSSNRLRATEMLDAVLARMTSSVVTNAADPDWSAEEIDRLIGVFLALNRAGRDKLLERADELQQLPQYHRE